MLERLWCTRGEVIWTEDTARCRTSICVKVKDAIVKGVHLEGLKVSKIHGGRRSEEDLKQRMRKHF